MIHYFLSDGMTDLEVAVAPDTDMDGTFDAICLHTGERLRINGWLILDMECIGGEA